MRDTTIYGLVDPRTSELRYVGKTVFGLPLRLRQHINDARRGRVDIWRFRWINELTRCGLVPEIFELEYTRGDWQEAEQFWIAYFRFIGASLVNATAGGDGLQSFSHSNDTRKKQSEAAKRRYADPAERKRSGDAVRSAYLDPVKRKNLRDGLRNVWTPEARARQSILSTAACALPGAFERLSAAKNGKAVSPETRAKISAAKKGIPRNAESIARQIATITGRTIGAETRRKISESGKNRWAKRRLAT